ncbi:hypothetical protein KI387_007685, partial [Taxus chinensis]
GSVVGIWVVGIDDVLVVNEEVEIMGWEADGSDVEVVVAVGMEEVCVVEVSTVLVTGGVGEVIVVME